MVVTMLCDTGERYLSKLYNDEWMRENQMLDAPRIALTACWAERMVERRQW
jgi:cystathionine beta-synthase